MIFQVWFPDFRFPQIERDSFHPGINAIKTIKFSG